MYEKAVQLVVESQFCSVSFICRELKIPFKEAMEIVNKMEQEKIVSQLEIGKPRKILYGRI